MLCTVFRRFFLIFNLLKENISLRVISLTEHKNKLLVLFSPPKRHLTCYRMGVFQLGVEVHVFNPSTQKSQAGGAHEFDRQSYTVSKKQTDQEKQINKN